MEKSRNQTSHVAGKKKNNKLIIKTIRFEMQWKMFSKSRKKFHHFLWNAKRFKWTSDCNRWLQISYLFCKLFRLLA